MRKSKNGNSIRAMVDSYLKTRRSLGYKLCIEGYQLYRFARFAEERCHDGVLTQDLAVAWANSSMRGSRFTGARRLQVIRPFARYCALFEPDTEVPATGLLGPAHRRINPHIYTEKELEMLMKATEELEPHDGLRPATMRCLFGLLASAGLRISEALQLSRHDFNPNRELLTIRMTKFRKSRYVPLHPTTVKELNDYCRFRDRKVRMPRDTSFFMNDNGRSFNYHQALHAFQRIRHRLGWDEFDGRLPRLYDFRHTFACRRLLQWYEQGTDIDWAVPLLSTYLGHSKVTDTYWYLTGIPELMTVAAERFENLTREGREDYHE